MARGEASHLRGSRRDSNAGAMSRQQTRPRGGAQPEARDGEPRSAGESLRTRQSNKPPQGGFCDNER